MNRILQNERTFSTRLLVHLGEKISYEGSGKHVGYQFWSSDKKRVF